MPEREPAPGFAPVTIERKEFVAAAAAADSMRVTFRSVGHLPIMVALLALSACSYLSGERRQAIHCRRDSGSCVITNDGPLHHERSFTEISAVESVRVLDEGSPKSPERAIELVTDYGRLRFELTENCGPENRCPETTRVSTQIRRFLGDHAQTQLDAEYGPFSSLGWAIFVGLFALLFGVVQLARVVVVVSPGQRRVLILEHHVLGRRRYGSLPLDLVATCMLDSYRRGRHSHPYVSLVSASGEQYQLTRSGPLQQWLRASFARRVTEALNAAKA